MRPKFLTTCLACVVLAAPVSAADAPPTKAAAGSAAAVQPAMTKYRNDMQALRADLMAKGLTLSADQAAKFWPLFEQYQQEQNKIIDAQLAIIQKYAASYDTLTGTDALAYVKGLLDRDAKMQALRMAWLEKFQAAVPAGTAARVIQIDRRLSQLAQAELSSQIPLVH
jgi:hypothetical protein